MTTMHYTLPGTSKYIHIFILIVSLIIISSCSFLSTEINDTGSIAGATQTGNTIAITSKTGVSLADSTFLNSITIQLFNTHDTATFITQTKLSSTTNTMGTYLFSDVPAGNYYIAFYYNKVLVGEAGNIIVIVNRETTIPQNSVTDTEIQSEYPNITKYINTQDSSSPPFFTTEICNDSIDNDGDTLLDCQDTECSTSVFCIANSSSNTQINTSTSTYSSATLLTTLLSSSSIAFTETYALSSSSALLIENNATTCFDGIDNDLDDQTDCLDPDCVSFSVCIPALENTLTKCQDSLDNDLDGFVDCDDSDCTIYNTCKPNVPEATSVLCNDNHDNDQDGLTDCNDSDCDAFCIPSDEFTQEECLDLIDNDNDGTFDCGDSDCLQYSHCSMGETDLAECTDGIDNDADSAQVDIQEYSCHHFYIAMIIEESHLCVDGVDNDRDGTIDCLDDGCSTHPSCLGAYEGTEANCQDGTDNDSDTFFDCSDSGCQNTMACAGDTPPENTKEGCFDIIDNDNDGKIDVQEDECHPFYLELLN